MSLGILVVDDSDFMRQRITSALSDYTIVAEAENGAKAVHQYKEHAGAIDLVMMDIVMRKANGVKATAAIKEIDPDARVIMVTSVGQREKMRLAAKAGADGYVTKPFDDEDIRQAVRDIVPAMDG